MYKRQTLGSCSNTSRPAPAIRRARKARTSAASSTIAPRAFKLMKKTAFLINTARGAIIDEAALVRALRTRRIAGAGLDVFEHEPKVDLALRRMPNVVLAPHLGSATVEVREEMANIVVDNILAFLAGKTPPNCVNPEVLAAK